MDMVSGDVKLTILADDHAGREGLLFEHGLSFYIETGETRILFDTGAGGVLEHNARALGIDLAETETVVLSHGHYDHTGGLAAVLAAAPRAEVFAHPGILRPRYAERDGILNPVQIPKAAHAALTGIPAERFHPVLAAILLSPHVGITGPIPRKTSFEAPEERFYLDPDRREHDLVEDDVALWVRTDAGLVVCAGCAHAGIINTLNWIQSLNGGWKIRAVIGGFHLLRAGYDRLQRTVAALNGFDLDTLAPCHCTGDAAASILRDAFPGRFTSGTVGLVFYF
jgi:7,8-dihydropterin-6-yl-methyl-4-(beta-D-ribofuranosyl)aminobenzene 5'-phosphate synthase